MKSAIQIRKDIKAKLPPNLQHLAQDITDYIVRCRNAAYHTTTAKTAEEREKIRRKYQQ
jgi:hypothetical protein